MVYFSLRPTQNDKLLGRIFCRLQGILVGAQPVFGQRPGQQFLQQKHSSTSPMAPVVAFKGKTGWPEAGALTGFSMMYCTAAWQVLEKKGVVEKVRPTRAV